MEPRELDDSICALEQKIRAAAEGRARWGDVWSDVRTIGQSFRDTRYGTRDEKQAAWERFQGLVGDLKDRQEREQRASRQRHEQYEARARRSTELKDQIIGRANAGRPPSGLEEALAGIVLLPLDLLARALGGGGILGEQRDHLRTWSEAIRAAWGMFRDHKGDMLGRDKQDTWERLTAIQEQCDDAWRRLKEAEQHAYEKRRAAREAKQQAIEERRQSFHARTEARIAELEERRDREEDKLRRAENHLDELREKHDSARSDGFRDRVAGWISEEESRIDAIRDKIARIEGWIREQRDRLS